jgi:hypothetical protein
VKQPYVDTDHLGHELTLRGVFILAVLALFLIFGAEVGAQAGSPGHEGPVRRDMKVMCEKGVCEIDEQALKALVENNNRAVLKNIELERKCGNSIET